MNTNYLLKTNSNHQIASGFNHLINQAYKQQHSNSILQDDAIEDDFTDGDFTKNLIIATLNNWSKQHFQADHLQPIQLKCPSVNYKN